MTDYSKMSDYEISCEVGRAISFADYLLARNEQKNYCNSWADAGPIILANRIGLTPSVDIWHAYSADEDFLCSISNPLRAAMIVFLMMKEPSDG